MVLLYPNFECFHMVNTRLLGYDIRSEIRMDPYNIYKRTILSVSRSIFDISV